MLMPLNLITDPWIPVLRNGRCEVIRPDQIAEPGVERPDWPRPDLNLACLELLIGLVYLACPPRDVTDWRARRADPDSLRKALVPLAPAFNLTGEGPLFLQDMEQLEGALQPAERLLIGSASENAVERGKNTDLFVHRGRYKELDLPTAAIALYCLQNYSGGSGRGYRDPVRGGGAIVNIVSPSEKSATPLWTLIWANVPEGRSSPPEKLSEVLPWMRPTRISKNDIATVQPAGDYVSPEVFFGMPTRINLLLNDPGVAVVGFRMTNYGTWYVGWDHPLTPYSEKKVGNPISRKMEPGRPTYVNWAGVLFSDVRKNQRRARSIQEFLRNRAKSGADILVAGWAMKKAKPLDFIWSEQPLFPLSPEAEFTAAELVEAADMAARALVSALKDALGLEKKNATQLDRAREAFFQRTQGIFEAALSRLASGAEAEPLKRGWLTTLRSVAERQFEAAALPGLAERDIVARGTKGFSRRPTALRIVEAKRTLAGKLRGDKIHQALRLDPPDTATKARAKAKASA